MKRKILIIDDDVSFSSSLAAFLRTSDFDVIQLKSSQVDDKVLKKGVADLILLETRPDWPGVDLVNDIKAASKDIPIIMISSLSGASSIVEAIYAGVNDYVEKPINNDELLDKITNLIQQTGEDILQIELGIDKRIIGVSEQTKKLVRDVIKIADSGASVLLRGESGTGKSLIAEIIHNYSARKDKPFVTVNCPAIPRELLESELFGHIRGSFTGAVRDKLGKFEFADKGTIFLDEIGDLHLGLQGKILRVIQEHELEPIGSLKTIKVDVRIVAATNQNLEQAVRDGRFREDLFYRLNVLPLYVPALRDRKDDIPLLADYFLDYFNRRANKHFTEISESVMNLFMQHEWPGNIRELQNVLERAIVMGKEPIIKLADIQVDRLNKIDVPSEPSIKMESLENIKRDALVIALRQSGGNVTKAAKILGTSRGAIYRRLKKSGIKLK